MAEYSGADQLFSGLWVYMVGCGLLILAGVAVVVALAFFGMRAIRAAHRSGGDLSR